MSDDNRVIVNYFNCSHFFLIITYTRRNDRKHTEIYSSLILLAVEAAFYSYKFYIRSVYKILPHRFYFFFLFCNVNFVIVINGNINDENQMLFMFFFFFVMFYTESYFSFFFLFLFSCVIFAVTRCTGNC